MAQGRAKRPHKKTKTGCLTCRKRRIKCDEAKPACRQCTDSLRKCEGYQPPQTWLFKPRNPPEQSRENMNLIHFVAPMSSIGDSDDKRSFQFWVEQAAPIFSCYFGHSFWTQLLPQLGFVRPAVKHMLLVTSSVVENTALEGGPLDQNIVYQSHYTKAIQATCSSPQVENVLLACLLFACCDFMKGSYDSGLRHIRSGLSIMDEWYNSIRNSNLKASPSARLIINAIGPIFVSYIDKSPTYGFGDITVDNCACAGMLTPSLELPYIAPFNHIHGALHALDGIAHYVARLMDWRKQSWTLSPPQKIQMLLDTWRMSFDRFETSLTPAKRDAYTMALSYLRIYHTMFGVMVRASAADSEAIYERFDEEFKWIVDRYDDFTTSWAKDDSLKFSAGTWANLEYHFGFIPPLFFTAIKCRDPTTRMAALNHLGSLRVVENNWTSCTAYVIAKKMMQIETNLSIINDRTDLTDQRDLIRPIEAYITDKRMPQAGLDYAVYPFIKDQPLIQHETIDLSDCPALSSPSARWPLARILRIGGYQGGGITPAPTNCHCQFYSCGNRLLYRPRT